MFQRIVRPVIFLLTVLLIICSSISKNNDKKTSLHNEMNYFENKSPIQRDRLGKSISRVTTSSSSETAQSPRIGPRQSIDDSSVAEENKYDLYSITENIFTEDVTDSYDSLSDMSQHNIQTYSSSSAQRQLVNITIPHPQSNSYFQKSIMENEVTRTERSFYAMGDTPYDDYEAYLLGKQLREINSATTTGDDNAATFIVHLGDVKKTNDCQFSEYANVRQILLQSRLKMFIIPGDNDFNDCPDPNEAWVYWMLNFKKFDLNWGRPTAGFKVFRQKRRIENFSFTFDGVLFISVNLLGGYVHNKTEWIERHRDNFAWTRRNLRRYYKGANDDDDGIDAVVLLGHSKRRGNNDDYFDRLFDLIERNYRDVPFLYLHGDGHRYDEQIKHDNFFDLQVDQGRKAPPLKVTISHEKTRRARDKFSLDRRGGRY